MSREPSPRHPDEQMKFLLQIKEPPAFKVTDDSMFPILQKGSTVTLEIVTLDKLKNGDIIGVILKGKKDIIFRKCFFVDDKKKKVNLFPMNASFETATFDMKNIKLIGKAKRIITNLE